MNYTTGTPMNMASADCVCAKEPQVAVPPLAEQIAFLAGKAEKCYYAVGRAFYFLNGQELNEIKIDDETVTANLAYIIRLLDELTTMAEGLSERWH